MKFFKQSDAMDCGPTCLQIIATFHGRYYSLDTLRRYSHITREGVSMMGISDASEVIGFRSLGVKVEYNKLLKEQPVPFIAHWNQQHFVVVYKIDKDNVWVADPAHGKVIFTHEEFIKSWASTVKGEEQQGLCLLLEPTHEFFNRKGESLQKNGFSFLFKNLRPHKKYIIQLVCGLLVGSLLQLIFPFLTQAVVDIGINTQNVNFIYLVLAAQLMLFISRMSVEFIRSWIMLHISTRVNISLISDFLIKLMRLPINFFDTKMTGDIIQRIEDHTRIEKFLTGQTLSVLFSFVNLILFSVILAYYNSTIFIVFFIGSFTSVH